MTRKTSDKKRKGAWKMERASVTTRDRKRPRSNKYSGGDPGEKPAPGARKRVWVGGYTRADGTEVKGHYREISGADGQSSR